MNNYSLCQKFFIFGLSVVLASFLAGCVSYKVRPLRALDRSTAKYVAEKDGVSIYAAPIERKELRKYFNGISICKKRGPTPLLVTIENRSGKKITLNTDDKGAQILSAEEFITLLGLRGKPSTSAQTVSFLKPTLIGVPVLYLMLGVGGMMAVVAVGACSGIGPSSGLVTCGANFLGGLGMLFASVSAFLLFHWMVLVPIFVVFGVLNVMWVRQFYVDLLSDIHHKLLSSITLGINESVTKLVFVPSDQLQKPLHLKVQRECAEGANQKKAFDMTLYDRCVQ